MAESTAKNQPKRKRGGKKAPAKPIVEADDIFDEEKEKLSQDVVEDVIKEIKSEVDDTSEALNENSANLMVLIDDLKKEEDFAIDDTSSSQDVLAGVDEELDEMIGVGKGKKRARATKGKQKAPKKAKVGQSSVADDIEDSLGSDFSYSVTSVQSSSIDHVNGMDSFSENDSESHLISDTEESGFDVIEGNMEEKPELYPEEEPRRRYPFRLSHSDYVKFTESALRHGFGSSSTDQAEGSQPQENGESEVPKKETPALETETDEENIDMEALRKTRMERLSKLNEAIDYIKDILDRLAQKESANLSIKEDSSFVAVKAEVDEEKNGEEEDVTIKEETEEGNEIEDTKEEIAI